MKSNRLVNLNSLQIPVYDSDPPSGSLTSPGLMWFNQTSGSVRFTFNNTGSGVWSVGGTMITARGELSGAGIQENALAFGGRIPGNPIVSCTEEYNGTSWSSGGNLITVRWLGAGAGTQNAALLAGGGTSTSAFSGTPSTEEYDGISWASGGSLIIARVNLFGNGTQNAALAVGGYNPAGPAPTFPACSCTEEYNGTTWTAGGTLIVARLNAGATGTQNSSVAFGGTNPGIVASTEEYDGNSWSAGNDMITARSRMASAGVQNAALGAGGSPATSATETYNGISWSSSTSLITSRSNLAGAGTKNTALAFGGTFCSCTEAYIEPYCIKTANFT